MVVDCDSPCLGGNIFDSTALHLADTSGCRGQRLLVYSAQNSLAPSIPKPVVT
jgi:hypothetical protein